jgi:phosphatidylserine/phosphatidylglycerophosphate/cardiolipin synthase-like enzyme
VSKKLAAALAVAATMFVVAPAAQAGRTVAVGPLGSGGVGADATFAEGSTTNPDNTILVNLEGLMDRAEAGSYIAGAMFSLTDEGRIEKALRRAAHRGVDLWLVYDKSTAIFDDWATLDPVAKQHLHIKECIYGCLSATPGGPNNDPAASIQHAKYFTFSRTQRYAGGAFSTATWVASAHLDANTGTDAWNNALSVFGDSGLNAEMEKTWRDQWNGAGGKWGANFDYYTWPNPNPAGTEGNGAFIASTSGTVGVWSPELQTDTLGAQLDALKAPAEGGNADCRVVVLENYVESIRSAVVDRLHELAQGGCSVRIAVNYVDGSPDYVDMDGPAQTELCTQTHGDLKVIAVRKMHDKAIAAYGTFVGTYRATVWTGSHNVTQNALRKNDELLFRVDGASALADQFFNEYAVAYLNTARDVCTAPA